MTKGFKKYIFAFSVLLSIAAFSQKIPQDTLVDSSYDWLDVKRKMEIYYGQKLDVIDYHLFESKLKQLTLLDIYYIGFDAQFHKGQMICSKALAPEISLIFRQLYWLKFPIYSIKPISEFDFDDQKSMAANNTSCFDFRLKTFQNGLSTHAFGTALDINPIQNPYVTQQKTIPQFAKLFDTKGQIRSDTVLGNQVIATFRTFGWSWGGYWKKNKDFMHFEKIAYL